MLAFVYVKNWEQTQISQAHEEKLNIYVHSLSQTLVTIDNILDSIQGLYNIGDNISRDNFQEFLKDKKLHRYGIQAIEWIPYIPDKERSTLEQDISQGRADKLQIWQYSAFNKKQTVFNREYYYPIKYTEPISNTANAQCIGYDVASDPTLKQALELARDTGLMVSSGAVRLESKQKLSFRSFVPIYKRHSIHKTVEERRQNIRGFVASLVLFDDLVERVLRTPKQRSDIFVKIVDTSSHAQHKTLYIPNWFKATDSLLELEEAPIEHAGRSWTIILATLSDQYNFTQFSYAWIVLAVGIFFTLGLWRYLFLTLTRAHWAEELVAARTQSLLEANNALDESRRRFEAVFDEAAMGIAQTDLDGTILDSNKALQDLLGYNELELQGKNLHYLAHKEDIDTDKTMRETMLTGLCDSYTIGKRYRSKFNESVWTNQNCSIVRDTVHPFIVSMIEDITERKCAEQARLEAEKKYRDIFENAIEGIFQCTPSGHYLSINPAFVRIFGYQSPEDMFSKITEIGQQLYVNSNRHAEFIQLLQTSSRVQNFEYEARCADGNTIWVSETVRVVRDENGEVRYYEGIVEDISERKHTEKNLRYDASHDQLTGLFNRAAFTERLSTRLQQLHSQPKNTFDTDIPFAVLFADLDRFKIVNDSMGHLAGDKLLTQIAHRLQSELSRFSEMVARFGGDEFVMMLEKVSNIEALEQRIEKIQAQLCQPYFLENETFNTTVSIGIAIGSENYQTADEVLRDADTAMYEAKKHGRGKAILFQSGMHTNVLNLLRMESDLRKALEREEFVVYYQPIISLETHSTIGFEALVRWNHPERGLVLPDEFIPIAEETGLIREIGLWVFKTACEQLREWQQKFPQFSELGININVSPIQLKQPRLVQEIQDILDYTGVKGPCCRVEITESAIMQDPETILKMLNDLKSLNVLLYIDDFGTGYTSLSYLKKFPVDALKIDKSFISEIRHPQDKSTQIAEAIIALGAAFDLKVVAEGVENDFQMSVLQAAHCDHVQGYLFSRPQCSLDTENYLNQFLLPVKF
ncbi:MAG: EAL domain-containing protein [Thiotrichaceae bacterium]|nr:EAL domain-containing protein [Thiotrichaceae bacterium]